MGLIGEAIARVCFIALGFVRLHEPLLTVAAFRDRIRGVDESPLQTKQPSGDGMAGTAVLNFNHFMKLEGRPTPEMLCAAFTRRAALYPALLNQEAYDIVIPACEKPAGDLCGTVQPDKMVAIFVQVKNQRRPLPEDVLISRMVHEAGAAHLRARDCHYWVLQRERRVRPSKTPRREVECASFIFDELFSFFPNGCRDTLNALLQGHHKLLDCVPHGTKPASQLRSEQFFYAHISALPKYAAASHTPPRSDNSHDISHPAD
ncbi:hypothetical protein GNI_218300 [Gregarina niphandrodes]|uniref:Uncharacterized protein n=1 Tax=Gregarina niphandrodes TaxID=110365 RepID=A0A023AW58_GRENI|nr:hypothetical protein GNI_218300 [Gregarina niphandrodes]EZG42837.1 hypothetical protein GNI_218300 [Gregarina niphandrodes]|eukprot:XP_011133884.1 hypothetical protein GNI_218300 [Gregarina niphandrodes]